MDNFLPPELKSLRESGEDFYIEPKTNVESYLNMLKLQEEVFEDQENIHTQLCFIMSDKDEHADGDFTREYFQNIQNAKHKEMKEVLEADHYMINWEHSYEKVQNESLQFMQRILQRR